MSIGAVENLLPHFLHGKSVAQIFHWPAQPANEFYSNNRSSLAHSWSHSLSEVGEVLRKEGYQVRQYDPLVEGHGYTSLVETVKGTDLLAILVPHRTVIEEFRATEVAIRKGMRTSRVVFF